MAELQTSEYAEGEWRVKRHATAATVALSKVLESVGIRALMYWDTVDAAFAYAKAAWMD
jgi:hypothetical protein